MKRSIINFVLFQLCWFACILGAAAGFPWTGVVIVLIVMAGHLAWMVRSGARTSEAALLLSAAVLGWIGDSLLVLAGLLTFPEAARLGEPTTFWMVALWVNLAMTLRYSMAWMRGRMFAAAVFGAVGGPVAYWAGARLGAVMLGASALTVLAAVAALWAIAMPVLLLVERSTRRWCTGGTP